MMNAMGASRYQQSDHESWDLVFSRNFGTNGSAGAGFSTKLGFAREGKRSR
jgi:hypothetical protein